MSLVDPPSPQWDAAPEARTIDFQPERSNFERGAHNQEELGINAESTRPSASPVRELSPPTARSQAHDGSLPSNGCCSQRPCQQVLDRLQFASGIASRGMADDVMPHCSFVNEVSFQAAERRAAVWHRPAPSQRPALQSSIASPTPTLSSRMRESTTATYTRPFGHSAIPFKHMGPASPPSSSRTLAASGYPQPIAGPSFSNSVAPPTPGLMQRLDLSIRISQDRTPSPPAAPSVSPIPVALPAAASDGSPPTSQSLGVDNEEEPPRYRGCLAGRQQRKRGAKKGSDMHSPMNNGP
ncbi:hypothetical protein Hypma_006374 [Hypsizygus marmoreus]|uniref:Uncharacterized protein n=1 Tax=Hypsizygus marmoreus TaxID=39966 RepID=A0A369K1V2_HYPMA|nr:hypothetical protein Hypma_006374 [Hypsizygus marmoreus]